MVSEYTNLQKSFRVLVNTVISVNNVTSNDEYQDPNTLPNINYPDKITNNELHEDYLFLLIFDLIIFIGLTVTSYMSSQKLASRPTPQGTSTAEDFKPKFIKGLIYANGSKYILK